MLDQLRHETLCNVVNVTSASEQPRGAMVGDRAIVAASFLADGASEPAFPDAGWADQGQIVVGVDPVALGELLEQGAIETTGGPIVDVFDARLLAQLCGA